MTDWPSVSGGCTEVFEYHRPCLKGIGAEWLAQGTGGIRISHVCRCHNAACGKELAASESDPTRHELHPCLSLPDLKYRRAAHGQAACSGSLLGLSGLARLLR